MGRELVAARSLGAMALRAPSVRALRDVLEGSDE